MDISKHPDGKRYQVRFRAICHTAKTLPMALQYMRGLKAGISFCQGHLNSIDSVTTYGEGITDDDADEAARA